jgi:putative oxidoreductase
MTERNLQIGSPFQTLTWTLLRVVAAGIYMQHGVQKAMSFFGHEHMGTLQMIALVMETIFAALIVFGLFTRVVTFLCSGEMAVAYFLFHSPRGFWPAVNHGETPVLLCFVFLYLSSVGGGPVSLDALLRRKATG